MNKLNDTLAQRGLVDIADVKASGAGDGFQFATCRYMQGGDVQLFLTCPAFTVARRVPTRLKGDSEGIVTAVTDLNLSVIDNGAVFLWFRAHKGESSTELGGSIL